MKDVITAKLVLLKQQRDQLVVNLHQHEGAIAVLEELLNPPAEKEPTT